MSDQRTEQPTPRRREKARAQGQIARSRELSSALGVLVAVLVLAWRASADLGSWRLQFRGLLDGSACRLNFSSLLHSTTLSTIYWIAPVLLSAWAIALIASFGQGGLSWATEALSLRADRLNPANKLRQLISVNALSGMLRGLVPVTAIVYVTCAILSREWNSLIYSDLNSIPHVSSWLFTLLFEIAWKSGLVMLLWSVADYLFVRYRVEGDLKMTREELRREHRENEGDPLVKARIRRLQRQARRRQMLQDVSSAAVVITNPTHYAIALAYSPEFAAPVLVAKGRDRLATEIKNVARWHDIPMVENPPLAHALYRAVSIGDSIPSRLYVAVAEVLAFVYRVQAAARNG